MKYGSKQELLTDIRESHDLLCEMLQKIHKSRYRESGVWGDDWTVSDLIAHLAEWQFMFLGWYEEGLKGETPPMPAPGYKWNEMARLNRAIWEKHRSRSVSAVRADFDAGYQRIIELVEEVSPDRLLSPGHFNWTGKHSLATYLGPNTASHYRFAMKVLKRWQKPR